MNRVILFLIITLLLLPTIAISSQNDNVLTASKEYNKAKVDKVYAGIKEEKEQVMKDLYPEDLWQYRKFQENNRMLLLGGVLIVTCVALITVLFFLVRNEGCAPFNIVNACGLVLVIQATLFVVVASDTHEQLTAAIGVIGAIAGYLFGSAGRRRPE